MLQLGVSRHAAFENLKLIHFKEIVGVQKGRKAFKDRSFPSASVSILNESLCKIEFDFRENEPEG